VSTKKNWRLVVGASVLLGLLACGGWFGSRAYLASQGAGSEAIDDTMNRRWLQLAHVWRKSRPSYRAAGRDLYEQHCPMCHGLTGEGGRGPSLAGLGDRIDDFEQFRVIRGGSPGGGMPAFWNVFTDDQVFQIVAHVGAFQPAAAAGPLGGDRARGADLFRGRAGCATCHDAAKGGASVAPDLSRVGRRRSQEFLRRKLIEPGKDVPVEYRTVRVSTVDGETVTGRMLSEDTFSIRLRTPQGAVRSFFRRELARLDVDLEGSEMSSVAGVVSDAELDDLVAYLASLGWE
jgi:putative heme-binding domain-containing protein